MAKTTLSFFTRMASVEGVASSFGGKLTGDETRTSAGAFPAAPEGTRVARLATDTGYTSDIYGAGTETLHPANSAEFFPVAAGQVVTLTALS